MANLLSIPQQHMENWGDALIAKNKPWTTTPEYHQWGTADLTKQKSKEIAQNYGNFAAGAFELAAPALALGASPLYDIPQAVWKYGQNPDKYLSRTDKAAKEAQENIDPSVKAALEARGVTGDYYGADLSGILTAINQEDVLSSAWNRMRGASWPLADRMKKGLTNVEKFGGKIYNYMHGPQMRFKQQQLMNRRKQDMQQRIRQAEAAEAAKKKAAADAAAAKQASLQARVTTQANREARRRISQGEGRDYGKTETRASSGWQSSPFNSGGLVNFYRYGGFI